MFRATRMPPLSILLDDIFERDLRKVAKHLGVTLATLKRWQVTDCAPRAALLALFHESRWGYALLANSAHNDAIRSAQEAAMYRRENAALTQRIKRLESIGDFGAANAPILSARRVEPLGSNPVFDLRKLRNDHCGQ